MQSLITDKRILGNLSYPSINRWGFNLFWYRFWYTDKNYKFSAHIDLLLEKIFYTYLFFGLYLKKDIFNNLFWYPQLKKKMAPYLTINDLKYFRLVEYRSKIFNEISSVRLRKYKKNIYRSKFWILKYQTWIIVNLYMFQPFTARVRKLRKKNLVKSGFLTVKIKKQKNYLFWKKNFFLNFYFFKFYFLKSHNYNF